jgi:hypothetical protein
MALTERKLEAAAPAAEYLRNSLLEIVDMEDSLFGADGQMLGGHYNLKVNSKMAT